MEIRLLTDEELTRIYREHLVPAFPAAELRPLHAMQDMARQGLDFYRRNGARQADYMAAVFGVPYHTLYLAEDQVDETAMMAAHRQAYRSRLSERAYQRFIHIPWDPSMGMPEKHPWEE